MTPTSRRSPSTRVNASPKRDGSRRRRRLPKNQRTRSGSTGGRSNPGQTSPAAWNNLGVLLLAEESYLGAAEAFQNAAERSTTDPRPIYNLGLTWERTRHLQEAQEQYAHALERDPRYIPALRGLIYAQDRLGVVDDLTLGRLRVALLREDDPQWRSYFELRKISAAAELAEQQ